MSVNSADDLRNLLRHSLYEGAPPPEAPSDGAADPVDIPVLGELASLIDSLDFDTTSTTLSAAAQKIQASYARDLSSADIANARTVDSSVMDMRDLLQRTQNFPNDEEPQLAEDQEDYSVLRYGRQCTIRGRQGRVLTAVPTTSDASHPLKTATMPRTSGRPAPLSAAAVVFLLGVDGQGVGDDLDTMVFVNADNKDDVGCVRYGDTVAVKSPAGKERYLGTRDASRLGFWRHFLGQGEKWTLLMGSAKGLEEKGSKGRFCRTGDMILLQNSSDMVISLTEGVEGRSAKLIHRDRAAIGGEVWQVEWCGTQPVPQWLTRRPYLSGSYLLLPPKERYNPSPDAVMRTFPRSVDPAALLQQETSSPDPLPLNQYPPLVQEAILMRELILALSGVEGVYIRVGAEDSAGKKIVTLKQITFHIDADSSDRGLAYQVELLLSVCDCANRIRAFIKLHSRYEYGTVSHAVAGAIRAMMREFDVVLAQFESQLSARQLTLQKMIFLLQPTKTTLRSLDHMTARLGDRVGGNLLDRLHSAMLEQGDERARKLYEHILKAAAVPFVNLISRWLYQGDLRDPYSEFFISEHTAVLREALQEDFNAHYWEGRYTLASVHVPRILQEHASRALTAGKYLNVIRDCCPGVTFKSLEVGGDSTRAKQTAVVFPIAGDSSAALIKRELVYDMDGSTSLIDAIDEAYEFSSATLLQLCEKKYNLYSHLKSLRRFFLLEHGDFFVQFMDTAEEELRREVRDVALPRIQGLLHMAVHTSTLSTDPNKDELSCTLASHNLIQHLHLIQTAGEGGSLSGNPMESHSVLGGSQGLKGVEALTLEYNVGWPLSIILSKRAITKYQLLSRLLFFCKHVELRVLDSWKDHQGTKEFGLRGEMGPSYCLRHRMLHFLQNFVYYMTIEVFTPRSHEMESAMSAAQNMDEVLHLHEMFLDTCLKECLLASQDLLRVLTKITTTCLLFADQMKRFADTTDVLDPELRGPAEGETENHAKAAALRSSRIKVQAEFISREVTHEAYVRMLAKFSDTFDSQLGEFLEKLWTDSYRHHPQLSNLCVRLDYNGFYDSRFSGEQQSQVVYGSSRSVV